jgi:hypothetical protein
VAERDSLSSSLSPPSAQNSDLMPQTVRPLRVTALRGYFKILGSRLDNAGVYDARGV